MYHEITITSCASFIEEISRDRRIMRKEGNDCSLLFRGQSDAENILLPSLGRNAGRHIDETFLKEERNMIEMAKFKLPEVFGGDMQPIDLLALLQHHGIPTRLLDISENALVALYFACCQEKDADKDGEVLLFGYREQSIGSYPMINAIAESYRFVRGSSTTLERFYELASRQRYFADHVDLYEQDISSVQEGAQWVQKACSDIMIIYAKSYGLRQRIQRGRYILFPNRIAANPEGKVCFEQSISPLPKDHKAIAARYLIPADCKTEILEDLRMLGISKDMLFLDNADIICHEIAERAVRELPDQ